MLLLIDNYDSFTYNLYQYLTELGAEVDTHRAEVDTHRNDVKIGVCLGRSMKSRIWPPSGIVISLVPAPAHRSWKPASPTTSYLDAASGRRLVGWEGQ